MAKMQKDLEINLKHHNPPKLQSFFEKIDKNAYTRQSKSFQKRAGNHNIQN